MKRFMLCVLFMVLILISGCSEKYKSSNNGDNGVEVVRVTEKQIEAIKVFQEFNFEVEGF